MKKNFFVGLFRIFLIFFGSAFFSYTYAWPLMIRNYASYPVKVYLSQSPACASSYNSGSGFPSEMIIAGKGGALQFEVACQDDEVKFVGAGSMPYGFSWTVKYNSVYASGEIKSVHPLPAGYVHTLVPFGSYIDINDGVSSCQLPWGGTINDGQSVTAYASGTVPYGSSCGASQTRTCSNGTLSGSFSYPSCSVSAPANCSATTLNWGAGNYCATAVSNSASGSVLPLTNSTAGATGSASATCSNGTWTLSGNPSCNASIPALGAGSLSATDGTVSGKITVTWGGISGATGYDVQYRKSGDSAWTLSSGVTSGWQFTTADESIFEFQVRGKNATGVGEWSATETGNIRKNIDPLFVSQAGIPAKVGVGQSFTFTQIWKNVGAETWTGSLFGTSVYSENGAFQWNSAFASFPGNTATNDQVGTTISAVAPSVPGVYTLQRIMQKNGVSYGSPSTPFSVTVLDKPTCTGVSADAPATFNKDKTVTVTLIGASSVESASIRVWGELKGESGGVDYPATFDGKNWIASFPVAPHLSTDETKINFKATVSNGVFASSVCASSSVMYQQLPVPSVTLIPTFGTFGDAARQGFVVNRAGGEFAKINVDLGAFSSTLKARVEVLDQNESNLIVPLNGVSASQQTSVLMASTTMNAATASWQKFNATLKVSYADPAAAAQGKFLLIPIAWTVAPGGLNVSASGVKATAPAVDASIAPSGGTFNTAIHGNFSGYVRVAPNAGSVGSTQDVSASGTWSVTNLDYGQLYAAQLVAVARAVPPAGITLFSPLEFVSAAFSLPVQAPLSVSATDGTREDDVQVVWPAIATGSAIRYRVFRDGVEVTPLTGIAAIEFIDVPPSRGTTYTYTVKTMINNVVSQAEASDTGFVPSCRAARLVGASLNADMSAINGLLEQWSCLQGVTGSGAVDSGASSNVPIAGSSIYRSFSYTLAPGLADGAHILHLKVESAGVDINADRIYDIPFNLARSSISLKSLTILYDGSPAQSGMEATSIGRFGVRMDGGSGLGFAEEIK